MNNKAAFHDYCLDQLVWHHMDKIGEDIHNIRWIMKDGIWLMDGVTSQYKLADIVASVGVDSHNYGLAAELKNSKKGRSKARKQLYSTDEYMYQELGWDKTVLKAVYYEGGKYLWETFQPRKMYRLHQ